MHQMCAPRHYLHGYYFWGTLRSRHGTCVDFDKICVFCDKCCVRIDKCVFIVVKIKCMNFGRISDICDKINFTTNYTHFTTSNNIYQNTHKYYNFWHLWRDLRISHYFLLFSPLSLTNGNSTLVHLIFSFLAIKDEEWRLKEPSLPIKLFHLSGNSTPLKVISSLSPFLLLSLL
jgi:hypothetical protein